jgi:hypothetical protein
VERVGWVLFGLTIIAALVGVFGSGPISSATANGPGFRVEYERFARQDAPSTIQVHFIAQPETEETQIWISQDFVRAARIESIVPEPSESSSSGAWVVYSLATQPGVSGTFRIDFIHQSRGQIPIRIGFSPGESVEISEFVYP